MIFEFNILGMLVLFILIILYFSRENRDEYPYKLILITSYITELLYILTFVSIKGGSYSLVGKIYFILLVIVYVLFSVYNITYMIKDRYKNKKSTIQRRLNILKIVTFVSIIVISVLVMVSKMYLVDDRLVFGNNIVNIVLGITIVIDGIVLIISKIGRLYPIVIMKLIILFVGLRYPNISIVSDGIVLITLYIYLVFENYCLKNLDRVKLERDYAIVNVLDKYAFLKNLSHEIRTPINTIDGLSQVIMDSEDKSDINDDLKDIRLASNDLIDTINSMIDLSIIESGNLEIINDNYDVYDMFGNISKITKSRLKDKKVKFIYNIEEGIPEVLLGDAERISQVVLNLLGNSIKYTDKGNITLDVSCIKSSGKVRLLIKVSDTGIGFKKEDLIHVFDKKDDNCIGLVLSNYLISMMNGKIDVDSTYNEGSTFVITIDQKIISEKSSKKDKNTKPFNAKGARILLVDDNKLNLKVAVKLLESYNVDIVEVNSGKECLDILDKDTDFDLILMDDLMPNMSGTEAMSIIKKIERVDGFYIPVVVLTANATSGMKEKYVDVGFDDYLAKPIDKDELNRVLKKFLKGKKKNSE